MSKYEQIKAKIVLDSLSPAGVRLTTFELTYPRSIHAEVLTHRKFSRNSASSRAIPVKKMLAKAWVDPIVPIRYGANMAGMSSRQDLSKTKAFLAKLVWKTMAYLTIFGVYLLNKLNLHKQWANRPLEWFTPITIILTSDQYGLENFFAQRKHPDAQPEIRDLAEKMYWLYKIRIPVNVGVGDWHMPYLSYEDYLDVKCHFKAFGNPWMPEDEMKMLREISTGRCGRVSYLTHDGKRNILKDVELFQKLRTANPPHWSPMEHCAQALDTKDQSGNFCGWRQFRKIMESQEQ